MTCVSSPARSSGEFFSRRSSSSACSGLGLYRASLAHEELEQKFDRLVQHDLKLADDAEVLLRLMADLETGKRGYLLTGDRTFLDAVRSSAKRSRRRPHRSARHGRERNGGRARRGVRRLVRDWIRSVSEPQIQREGARRVPWSRSKSSSARCAPTRCARILTELRNDAIKDAREQQSAAFESVEDSRRETTGMLLVAIVIALASAEFGSRAISRGRRGSSKKRSKRRESSRRCRCSPIVATSSAPSGGASRRWRAAPRKRLELAAHARRTRSDARTISRAPTRSSPRATSRAARTPSSCAS